MQLSVMPFVSRPLLCSLAILVFATAPACGGGGGSGGGVTQTTAMNARPMATINAPTSTASGSTVIVRGTVTDADASDAHIFRWSASAGSFTNPAAASTTWRAPTVAAGNSALRAMLTLIVNDRSGASNATGTATVTITVNTTSPQPSTLGLCARDSNARTPQVRAAILTELRVDAANCDAVTRADLNALRTRVGLLELGSSRISSLRSNDFADLTSVTGLSLPNNQLTTLPAGVFDGLTALTRINLFNNRLTLLPAGVFDDLTALTSLSMWHNRLVALPAGVFDRLEALQELFIHRNPDLVLTAGVFDEVTDTLTELSFSQGTAPTPTVGVSVSLARVTVGDVLNFSITAERSNGATPTLLADMRVEYAITGSAGPNRSGVLIFEAGGVGSISQSVTVTTTNAGDLTLRITSITPLTGAGADVPDASVAAALVNPTPRPVAASANVVTPGTALSTSIFGLCARDRNARTLQVRAAILAALNPPVAAANCGTVTRTQLNALNPRGGLSLSSLNIANLRHNDFADLNALRSLQLRRNRLTVLPTGIFDGLSALTSLGLGDNRLTTLPAGVFDHLGALRGLFMRDNPNLALAAGAFDGVTDTLTTLDLVDTPYRDRPTVGVSVSPARATAGDEVTFTIAARRSDATVPTLLADVRADYVIIGAAAANRIGTLTFEAGGTGSVSQAVPVATTGAGDLTLRITGITPLTGAGADIPDASVSAALVNPNPSLVSASATVDAAGAPGTSLGRGNQLGVTATSEPLTVRIVTTPAADADGNRIVSEGASVTLTGNATDPEGRSIRYAWAQTGTPAVTLVPDDTSAEVSFTAPTGLSADTEFTFTLTADTGVSDEQTASAIITVTADLDSGIIHASETVLPDVLRAMSDNTARAIEQRMTTRAGGAGAGARADAGSLVGHLRAVRDGNFDAGQVLRGALNDGAFVLPLNGLAGMDGMPGGVVLWGEGGYRDFDGKGAGGDWDGELYGVHIGADVLLTPALLAGLAISWNESSVDYDFAASGSSSRRNTGEQELSLVSANPYLRWSQTWGELWATVGYGQGELETTATGRGGFTRDTELLTLTAGGSTELWSDDVVALNLNGRGTRSTLDVDAEGNLPATDLDGYRVNLGVEAVRTTRFASGRTLVSSLEAAWRHEGGDGETGNAAEFTGSLRYPSPTGGLSFELSGHGLLGRDDYDEWGVSGAIVLDPGASGSGLSFSLRPGIGFTQRGLDALWEQQQNSSESLTRRVPDGGKLKMELGYGLLLREKLLKPYTRFSFDKTVRNYWLGARLQSGDHWQSSLEFQREEGHESTDHSILLEFDLDL